MVRRLGDDYIAPNDGRCDHRGDMTETLEPRDHAEAVALFRAQVVGALAAQQLRHGELCAELHRLSKQRFRAPGSKVARRHGVSTLERWLYAYKAGGLGALKPAPRSDRGHGRALSDTQRELALDIKREHPTASAELIVRTLVADGRLEPGQVSPTTLRRLFVAHGLDRRTLRQRSPRGHVRQRWQAASPNQLWHADVCHGPALRIDGRSVPLRIHAILDDATRYVVAIQALSTEREVDMLGLFGRALRTRGRAGTLYLDNGSTYSGQMLATACGRLKISLVHARPYDPEARGKMERFWRTLRAGCLDHMGTMTTLHDVQVRLLAWLDRHYHANPHGGLLGRSPADAMADHTGARASREQISEAFTARQRRLVRKDGTVPVGGVDWEVREGFLAGRRAIITRDLSEPTTPPRIEFEGRSYALERLDPIANSTRGRTAFTPRPGIDAAAFDPPGALLRAWTGHVQDEK